jgi:hypothetical protein
MSKHMRKVREQYPGNAAEPPTGTPTGTPAGPPGVTADQVDLVKRQPEPPPSAS